MKTDNTPTKALRKKILRYHKKVNPIQEHHLSIATNKKSTREELIYIIDKYKI